MNIFGSIVTFENNKQILHKAIVSCLKSPLVKKFYIIDNSLTDDLKALTALDNRIKYIFNPSNPGFGAAHNIVMLKNIKISAKYYLGLNTDSCLDDRILGEVFNYTENNPNVGLIIPKVLFPHGKIQYLCKLLLTSVDLIFRRFLHLKNLKKKSRIRRQTWQIEFFQ